MRAYWILPNRDQRDDILASDGKTTVPLRRILDPKLRPEGFSHGAPTELLEKWRPKTLAEILFAQRFPGWNGDKQLFSVSTPAGADSSGRVVHLGLLFILEPRERPEFELPYASLPAEDQPWASALIHRMTVPGPADSWVQSVRDLIDLPSADGPATNVALDRSVARFHSLYDLGPDGLTRKSLIRRVPRLSAVILVVLFAVAGVWLSSHACEQSPRTAVRTGAVTWHFS